MTTPWGDKQDRREFLRRAALVAVPLLLGGLLPAHAQGEPVRCWLDTTLPAKLNPAFRVEEIPDGGLRVFTHLQSGELLEHTFRGLEADLIRELQTEEPYESLATRTVARNRVESEPKTRVGIDDLIDELYDAGLICGDRPFQIVARVME